MALNKVKIGEIIEVYIEKCDIPNLTVYEVAGINNDKEFFTPTVQVGEDTSNYKIVPPGYFACNLMHVGRDFVIPIALNKTSEIVIVSPAYSVFSLMRKDLILTDYLYMIFKKIDFDRYASFCTDSSIRDGLEWNRFCDIEIDVPSLDKQQKAVDVYLSLVANQKAYEKGLEELKLTYEAFIENLRKHYLPHSLRDYFEERIEINKSFINYEMKGVGQSGFINPVQERTKESLIKCNIFYENDFVYNPSAIMTGAIAISQFNTPLLCTEEYVVFHVRNSDFLLPKYAYIWMKREEFYRYIWFSKIDSVRNRVYFKDLMEMLTIPIPPIEIQKLVVEIFKVYEKRKEISENLKKTINDLCPILIKGSVI